jgi:putative sigma-54 modulation protein
LRLARLNVNNLIIIPMKVEIQSIHFKADKKLLEFVTKKIEKLATFYDGIRSAEVFLRLEKDAEKENKVIEVKVNLNANTIFAKEQSTTFESGMDMLMDKLVTQVRKYKEKHQSKLSFIS